MREPKRPGKTVRKTVKMIIPCVISLKPGKKDIIEYCTVDKRGYPVFRRVNFAGLQATVIVGHRNLDNLSLNSEDKVFICQFGPQGHLSSVGKDLEGQELTVIVHIPEEN